MARHVLAPSGVPLEAWPTLAIVPPLKPGLAPQTDNRRLVAMKTRIFLFCFFVTFLRGAVFAADSGTKLNVLVVTGGHGFQREPFFKMFADNRSITFTEAKQTKTSEAYDRDDLAGFDVVVLYDMVQNITDAQKAKFLSLFDKGIGLVVLHHALVSYQHWPEYERIIGGRYPEADGKSGVVTPEV